MLKPRDLIAETDYPVDAITKLIGAMKDEGHLDAGDARRETHSVLAEIAEPLRIAVVGKTKAGKSTLINSLVGIPLAPTDALSCTKFVAWFRDGAYDWAHVRLLADSRTPTMAWPPQQDVPIVDGVNDEDIDDIHVWRSGTPRLRIWTVIDTPGHNDTDFAVRERTLRVFRRHSIDAVLFVLNGSAAEEELQFFTGVRNDLTALPKDDSAESTSFAGDFDLVNTVAVLSRIDLANVDDPFGGAQKVIDQHAGELKRLATTVIPVLGLLAESARVLTNDDYECLVAMSGLQDHQLLAQILPRAAAHIGLDVDRVDRIAKLFGVYGLAFAIGLIRSGDVTGHSELAARMLAKSGLDVLEQTLRERFTDRVDALKARTAVRRLEKLVDANPDLAFMRPYLDRIDGLDRMHTLREMIAYEQWKSAVVTLPSAIGEALDTLAKSQDPATRAGLAPGASPAEIKAALYELIAECDEFLGEGWSATANDIARMMRRSYSLMLKDLESEDE